MDSDGKPWEFTSMVTASLMQLECAILQSYKKVYAVWKMDVISVRQAGIEQFTAKILNKEFYDCLLWLYVFSEENKNKKGVAVIMHLPKVTWLTCNLVGCHGTLQANNINQQTIIQVKQSWTHYTRHSNLHPTNNKKSIESFTNNKEDS